LRNHCIISEVAAGRGPIHMVTMQAFQDPHLEEVGWENFLGMTVGQAVLWAATDVDPKNENPELTTSEPYVMGSHATCSGAWCSGPEDVSPPEYFWGYTRMTTVEGLFGAGDAVGGTPHAFSSGSFTEGRLAAKAACKYIDDGKAEGIVVSAAQIERRRKAIYKPLEHYRIYRNAVVAGTVNPHYINPQQGLDRLQKLMDEYCGGYTVGYMTNEKLLNICLKKLEIMEEDLESLAAKDLHELLRAWELRHRHRAAECVTQHTLFRKETRWPGYYYRGDAMNVDDENWHVLTVSRRDPETGEYTMERAPCYHLVADDEVKSASPSPAQKLSA
jgi:adenylylsulfate reductase subunit A